MITPTQEQITAHLTTMTSKAFYEAAALSCTTFAWISSTTTTLSSAAPPWLSDFLGETLLFFVIGDDFDSYRAVNTAIVLLTAWTYYKAFRVVFLTLRFIFRTILGIYRIVRSVFDTIFGFFYSMARSFSSFTSSEEKQKSNSNNCQRLRSSTSPNQQQQQRQRQKQESEVFQQHRNATSVNMPVPTVVGGLQRSIPTLSPTFSSHQQQPLPQPERVPSISPQLQENQPAWIATPPPGVLRYNHCSPMAPQFVPIPYPSVPMASFPTQQQQQEQQFPPTSNFIDPPPLPRAPVFVPIPDTSDNNKSDNSNSEDEYKTLCPDSDSEDDPDGDWNEQNCLRVMMSANDTKNSKRKNATASTTATTNPTKKESKVTAHSAIKSTTTEQGNKRKRGATKLKTENTAPTQQSKKLRIAAARANAKKWANETFAKN
uniref:Uncharacterized protein n=1 Tax=Pseudo-nitzschia australis TaxID=44445 RepID=A0A7S4EJX9_9STRA|mmetsp:Transcript_9052/g.19548  ORF Transcript_9052/g.19548 Transcript_9052/m.19548 type:complete len:430 (+) Transcript_9052:298-1587(+)